MTVIIDENDLDKMLNCLISTVKPIVDHIEGKVRPEMRRSQYVLGIKTLADTSKVTDPEATKRIHLAIGVAMQRSLNVKNHPDILNALRDLGAL